MNEFSVFKEELYEHFPKQKRGRLIAITFNGIEERIQNIRLVQTQPLFKLWLVNFAYEFSVRLFRKFSEN